MESEVGVSYDGRLPVTVDRGGDTVNVFVKEEFPWMTVHEGPWGVVVVG